MTKRNASHPLAWSLAVVVAVAASGCGDDRPKIRKPDNPSPIPDESLRLSNDSEYSAPPQPER